MDKKIHEVSAAQADEQFLSLRVDGRTYHIRWEDASPALAHATPPQRAHMIVAGSGYGIHWPELDEDLAITPLLQHAQTRSGIAAE